jgi:uncharacterized protein YutE (UPF0331/DUF86 family)
MIDAELVLRKLAMIIEDLERVRPLAALSASDYLAAELEQAAAERYLERMIGRMIDICFHLVTEHGERPPPDYYDSFLALGKLGVLTAEQARRIAPAAGLRNRLAHEYDAIDPGKVHAALQDALRDIPDFVAAVRDHLAE